MIITIFFCIISFISPVVAYFLKTFVDKGWQVLKMILFWTSCKHDGVLLPRLDYVNNWNISIIWFFFWQRWNIIKEEKLKFNQSVWTERYGSFSLYLKQFFDPITRDLHLMCKYWVILMVNLCTIVKMIKVLHIFTKVLTICLMIEHLMLWCTNIPSFH